MIKYIHFLLLFFFLFLPTTFLICIDKSNRKKYSAAVIVPINTNTCINTNSNSSTSAIATSSATNSSIFLKPVFFRLYRNGSKLKRYLNYISSLEKQNVISYTNVKYVTPIKKRKKQFILLKSKDDEDISINICRLGYKKKQKRAENHVNLIESKHTEFLCKDKNGGIKKNQNNRGSNRGNNRVNNKKRNRKENKEMELEMSLKKKQDLLNFYSNFDNGSSEKKKIKNIENKRNNDSSNNRKDKREITETGFSDDYDGDEDGNDDEDENEDENEDEDENGNEKEIDSESEINRKRKNIKSLINTSFSESSGGNYDDGDNNDGTDEDEDDEDKDEEQESEDDEEEEEEENEDENEDEKEEDNEEDNKDSNTEKGINSIDRPKKENEEISVHERGDDEEEKKKCIDEYNRLIQLISESENKRLAGMKKKEKKEEYEFSEKIINSSRKWNIEHLKKEIERNFKPNEVLEKKIQGYMPMFTQDVKNETEIEDTTNTYTTTSVPNPERDNIATNSDDLITDEEKKENIKILKKINAGDYSDIDKFHFKYTKKDLERMQKLGQEDSGEQTDEKDENLNKEEEEEKKLIDELFLKIQSDKHNVLGRLRQKEQEILELYKQKRKGNEIERNEELENLIYYNKQNEEEMERRNLENVFNETVPIKNTSHMDKKEKTNEEETDINPNMFFKNDEKFVYIKEEKIRNMSEAQIRDELRKRNYPTFGSVDAIRDRLLQVMKIKKNGKLDIREIIRNPEEHALSNIQLNKLRETVKTYKEASACGDMDSKLKQIDAALEISNFLKDPAYYLRVDSFQKMGQTENNTNMLSNEKINKNEDFSKAPILNDYNFDKEITMAEKLKKTFNLDNEEREPDRIKRIGSDEDNSYGDEELDEEKEELRRREILKHGSLQETILEFHYKHDLSLDFIGDFICKFTDVNIEQINTYKILSEKEMQNYSMNDLEKILNFTASTYSSAYPYASSSSASSSARAYSSASYISPSVSFEDESSLNKNVFVPKFVDVNEFISKYLSTKHIVMLIEYSNIADPVDIDQYYVPENLYMLSEEYGLPIQDIIDACTHLNIKLPFGGETHLNKECFNALTVYINKHKKVRKQN